MLLKSLRSLKSFYITRWLIKRRFRTKEEAHFVLVKSVFIYKNLNLSNYLIINLRRLKIKNKRSYTNKCFAMLKSFIKSFILSKLLSTRLASSYT
jgi:hypothetical protein